MKGKKLLALTLALVLAVGLLAGCGTNVQADPQAQSNSSGKSGTAEPTTAAPVPNDEGQAAPTAAAEPETAAPTEHTAQVEITPLAEVKAAESYEEIRTLFVDAMNARYSGAAYNGGMRTETAADGDIAEAPAAAEGGAGGYGGDDFGTNVQVAGIDEADNVKTDGTYLYIQTDMEVSILLADGANTHEVGKLLLTLDAPQTDDNEERNTYANGSAILVHGDRLALIYNLNIWGWDENDNWYDRSETHVAIYDISDRSNPVLVTDLGQDGYYNSARMKDGVIYLISNQWIYDISEEKDPESFIPRVCANGAYTLLDADRIYICPQPESSAFTVVAAYDLDSAVQRDACAFTEGSDTIYMNADALYLTRTVTTQNQSEPYQENQYEVVDYVNVTTTEIKRIPLSGALAVDKTVTLDGSLLNQFSMDVWGGNLRVATTESSNSYSIFTDPNYGWQNYRWADDDSSVSTVTVFDSDLNVIGKLTGLGADERIYSVRFLGDLGYVVTYESIDPVFTVDLTDPTNPTLAGALELPGVSQYLHLFRDGELFGFGQALDENQASQGLQLSMFDVSDPENVTLEGKTVLYDSYSEVLYNHHAILVSGAQNLIAFPMQDNADWSSHYVLYSFENGGFTQRGEFSMDYYPDGARGILLDGFLYICSTYDTYVVDLESYEMIAQISGAMG